MRIPFKFAEGNLAVVGDPTTMRGRGNGARTPQHVVVGICIGTTGIGGSRNEMAAEQAIGVASEQVKAFMIRQTREADLMLMVELSQQTAPKKIEDISLVQLIPAYMLSELKTAFQIGFIIFLPFLLIDLVVSSILMSLGMMMVPPITISLPLKILMFVLIDGWNLVVRALISSFH